MAIPKIVHYCWFGGKEKPDSVKKCIESWKKFCPDYTIIEWNEENLDLQTNAYTREAYNAKAWGFVPDFLRLKIIFENGGIYLDTDVQVIKSFDKLLDFEAFAGFEDDEHIALGLGFGAEKNSIFLNKHMKIYENLHFLNDDGTFNRTPSPQYTTVLLKKYGLEPCNGRIQKVLGVTLFPKEYFCPKSFETGITKVTKNTISIHQFDASWYTPEEQAQRNVWERAAKIDYYSHTPNRIVKWILGDKMYEKVKKLFKR